MVASAVPAATTHGQQRDNNDDDHSLHTVPPGPTDHHMMPLAVAAGLQREPFDSVTPGRVASVS
jgi:hypothetical protein